MISLSTGHAEVHSVVYPLISVPHGIQSIPWSCGRHRKTQHDFFISYRVMTEQTLATRLFGELELKKTGTTVFLDALCLPHSMDWKSSFEYGLKHSKVIVVLVRTSF